MASPFKNALGQATVELTMAAVLIFTVAILAARSAVFIKNKFRHDFIEPSPQADFHLKLKSLIFFKGGKTRRMQSLEDAGWKFERSLGDSVLMSKDDKSLLVTDKLGILL